MRRLALILVMGLLIMTVFSVESGREQAKKDEMPHTMAATPKVTRAYITEVIEAAASTYNLPASLITAVIKAESGFNPKAVSSKGAVGLMQLSLSTRKAMNVTNPFDPVQNILAGARYLRHLLDRFNGNVEMAIAAYNAGPEAVKRHGGIPPYAQTRAFVPKVMEYYSDLENGSAID